MHKDNTHNKSEPELTGDPWDTFCDTLRQAGKAMRDANASDDELAIAEGYRYLMRMIRVGFELTHEYGDPQFPTLTTMIDSVTSYEGAGSDARYLHAFIDGTQTYRISGTRGTAPLIEIGVYTGKVGFNDTASVTRSITEEDLIVDDDGSIDIVLSPNQHDGNWLATDQYSRYLMIRQYSHDWSRTTRGMLTIEREGGGKRGAPGLAQINDDMHRTAEFVSRQARFWGGLSRHGLNSSINQFVAFGSEDDDADLSLPTGHRFASTYFRLAPDEVLICRFLPCDVPFWSFELANYWYEVIGYGREETHLNNKTVVYAADGSVTVAIAHRSNGFDNELLTLGHREGTAMFRWSRSLSPIPDIETRLVKTSDLEHGYE
ncbi:MAG: DUF1214 domain-containing protein [Halieaceae bacterium]|jgi:hypothetical protein|nr:DUF1214 domain-containing protein [Halieaceae bacterium]